MWLVTLTVKDRKNKSASFSLNFDATKTIAQIEGFITAIAPSLNQVIRGAVTAINITRSMAIPITLAGSATDDSDVEEGMRWQSRTGNGFVTSFVLPAIEELAIIANGTAADEGNLGVTIIKSALEDGVDVGGTLVRPTDNRGEAIDVVESINGTFKSSRGSR